MLDMRPARHLHRPLVSIKKKKINDMTKQIKWFLLITLIFLSTIANSQSAEIIKLDEKNAYQYKSYYEDGSVKSIVGFYAKKSYSSVEAFEAKLKDYKIKEHGEQKEFYKNGQLKEIVVYKKGKVVEFAKNYFEDGEEYSVANIEMPKFQFDAQQYQSWFNNRIQEIEKKNKVNLEGKGLIALNISKNGTIKSIKVRAPNETQEKYLLKVAEQIKVTKPAKKDGQDIGTKFAFRIQL